MIKLKVYLYDSTKEENGYRGTEYTNYCLQAGQDIEDITQEIDATEITLMGIDRKEEFTPSTKFIIDITENDEIVSFPNGNPMTLHREVSNDFVSQPIIEDENYFKHEISLCEPSVNFQHRIVDNIAITYKLKDVSLDTLQGFNIRQPAVFNNENGYFVPPETFGYNRRLNEANQRSGKYLTYELDNADIKGAYFDISISSDTQYIPITKFTEDQGVYKSKIILPHLKIMGGVTQTKNFQYIGDASYSYEVLEYNEDDTFNGVAISGNIITNTDFSQINPEQIRAGQITTSGNLHYGLDLYVDEYGKEWLIESSEGSYSAISGIGRYYIRKYSDTTIQTLPTYETPEFEVKVNKKYIISFKLFEFDDNVVQKSTAIGVHPIYKSKTVGRWLSETRNIGYSTSVTATSVILSPNVYNGTKEYFIYNENDVRKLLTSAQPYSVLYFLQKAILNSGDYNKLPDIATGELNYTDSDGTYSYNAPIYIDEAFITELSQTNIVENFYNQKNLWEIFIEAGYYIHAIPEIRFGANNKYVLTFNRLGETKETEGVSTPMAIYNFRGIDDYIAETDSYVANMVQLGGYRDEWLPIKSSDENFLVNNEVAEIVASSNIIELLGVQFRANKTLSFQLEGSQYLTINEGETTKLVGDVGYSKDKDATQYIYEENVYKILDNTPNIFPNKGVSLYYRNGTNKIIGCNYRLPTQNSGELYGDYALKKVIFCAFLGNYPILPARESSTRYWSQIKVNDFSVRLIYRTKGTVRQSHARPDLRKYLLASKFDNVPTHRQFNNQQDILVDSEKFGSNMYGTLIRTGNTNYKKQEWVSSPTELKHKGEICKINDEIYYVAKVLNIYYTDHIESMVEYSKDYNQLSKVIGIPSEPRFYEISEQSLIQREKSINDYLYINTTNVFGVSDSYLQQMAHLQKLMFTAGNIDFARYGVLVFKGDKDNGARTSTFGVSDFYKEIICPLNAYSSGTTLTYELDTADNFSAGDKVVKPQDAYSITTTDGAYKSLQAVQYTDKYGKATLLDFFILDNITPFTTTEIQNLPESPIGTRYSAVGVDYDFLPDEKLDADFYSQPTETDLLLSFIGRVGQCPTLYDIVKVGLQYGDYDGEYLFYSIPKTVSPINIDIINQAGSCINGNYYKHTGANGTYYNQTTQETVDIINGKVYYCFTQTDNATIYINFALFNNATFDTVPHPYIGGIQSAINYALGTNTSAIVVSNVKDSNTLTDYHNRGNCLIKDCREQISVNYNLKAITDSDTFILSPFLFQPKVKEQGSKYAVSLVFLSEEVNKLSNGYFNNSAVLNINGIMEYELNWDNPYTYGTNAYGKDIITRFSLPLLNSYDAESGSRIYVSDNIPESYFTENIIKSVVVAYNFDYQGGQNKNKFIIAKNIPQGWTKSQALRTWYFQPYTKNIFTNKQ